MSTEPLIRDGTFNSILSDFIIRMFQMNMSVLDLFNVII